MSVNHGKQDLYKVLNIEKSANQTEIKRAYFNLARVHHPDKGGETETFKEINRAYEVLSNEQKRQIYDMTGQIPGESGGIPENGMAGMAGMAGGFPFGGMGGGAQFGFNIDELFGIFGQGGIGGNINRNQTKRMGKPPPKVQHMKLDLKQFYYGQNFNLNLDRQKICRQCDGSGTSQKETCSDCRGSGAKTHVMQMGGMIMESRGPCSPCQGKGWRGVGKCGDCAGIGKKEEKKHQAFSLQPGMKSGECVVLSEVCSEMTEFERAGDLQVIFDLNISSSPWIRQGQSEEHLVYNLQINLAESLLGLTVKLDGHPAYPDGLWVRIRGCLLHGDVYCLNDMGMPIQGQSGKYGNGYIQIIVRATAEERATLLGSGRTGSLEELFSEKCRRADDSIQESDIFTDIYLSDFKHK